MLSGYYDEGEDLSRERERGIDPFAETMIHATLCQRDKYLLGWRRGSRQASALASYLHGKHANKAVRPDGCVMRDWRWPPAWHKLDQRSRFLSRSPVLPLFSRIGHPQLLYLFHSFIHRAVAVPSHVWHHLAAETGFTTWPTYIYLTYCNTLACCCVASCCTEYLEAELREDIGSFISPRDGVIWAQVAEGKFPNQSKKIDHNLNPTKTT
ncbi:hypothetical protein F4802DRAFT_256266 [Xylaria palmicola]|nr:hypothetical protein F4802DRAFT_256266 [Xylaria palmicola]